MFSLLILVSTLISILFGFIIYKIFKIQNNIKKFHNVPGPKHDGIVKYFFGDLPSFLAGHKNGVCTVEYLTNLIQEYDGICKVRFMDKTFVICSDPEIVKAVLINEDFQKYAEFYKIWGFPFGERFIGNGVLTEVDHEKWKKKRAILDPGFHQSALMTFLKEFNLQADVLMNHLMKFADGKTKIGLLEEFNRITLDIIANIAFSMNVHSIHDRNNQFSEYIRIALQGVDKAMKDPFFKYKPHNWFFLKRHREALRALRKIGYDELSKRLEILKNGEPLPKDILSIVLQNTQDDLLNVDRLVDDFVTFFMAGQETTSTTVAFAVQEICRNPEVLDALRNEIHLVLGSKSEIEYKDLIQLNYTSAVVKETLRLYPPVGIISRFSHKELITEKCTIPNGTWIVLSTFASARMEKYFPDPLTFKPERFLDDSVSKTSQQAYAYFPFSRGKRNCMGQNFGQIEAKVIIAKLVQRFDFRLDPDEKIGITEAITLRPKGGTNCFLTPRH